MFPPRRAPAAPVGPVVPVSPAAPSFRRMFPLRRVPVVANPRTGPYIPDNVPIMQETPAPPSVADITHAKWESEGLIIPRWRGDHDSSGYSEKRRKAWAVLPAVGGRRRPFINLESDREFYLGPENIPELRKFRPPLPQRNSSPEPGPAEFPYPIVANDYFGDMTNAEVYTREMHSLPSSPPPGPEYDTFQRILKRITRVLDFKHSKEIPLRLRYRDDWGPFRVDHPPIFSNVSAGGRWGKHKKHHSWA
jgi:hypothetical protein